MPVFWRFIWTLLWDSTDTTLSCYGFYGLWLCELFIIQFMSLGFIPKSKQPSTVYSKQLHIQTEIPLLYFLVLVF